MKLLVTSLLQGLAVGSQAQQRDAEIRSSSDFAVLSPDIYLFNMNNHRAVQSIDFLNSKRYFADNQ